MKAILALENGSVYEGKSIGVGGERAGWVSFFTGVVGYQEVMTNPANAGKIIVMTYPLIGNYGVAKKFMESENCWIAGMVIKENTRITSNWQAEGDFDKFLKDEKVLTVGGIDTRTLMVELRNTGEQFGIISTRDFNAKSLKRKIKLQKTEKLDITKKISVKKATKHSGPVRNIAYAKGYSKISNGAGKGLKIAILDMGTTNSLIGQLKTLGCKVILLPYGISSDDILKLSPKGLIISDGPEMDKGVFIVVDTVKRLLGKLPIFGVGAGCQVLAMAIGGRVEKMYLGHHGVNYPILKPRSLKGEITVQNHSYVIDEASLKGKDVEITWRNINDKTIEGIDCKKMKASGCQFYPASPGMGEVNPILEEFIGSIKRKS